MRTLKKTLCMVLCLAMMVGLFAVSASAITFDDYTDKDEIQHVEAVKVLTAIGVLQGDDHNAFRATEPLNRAESATFFTKLRAASGAGTPSFTDMGGYTWANGEVAYCEQNGIIAGYGDGTFGPGDPTIYVQWAKMCLVALGYDPVAEGLVGDKWMNNTIMLVNKLGLANGTNPDWTAPIPRDDAAQIAYNTLTTPVVEYKGNLSVTTTDGTRVDITNGASPVINNSYDYKNDLDPFEDDIMEYCEMYFPNLKMQPNVDDEAFGFTNNIWYAGVSRVDNVLTDAKTIAIEQASNTMKVYDTAIAGVSPKTLYNDGKALKAKAFSKIVVNGYEFNDAEMDATAITMDRLATTPVLGGYYGATAYLIDTSAPNADDFGIADTLIIKQPLLAKVTKITAATATADRTATLTVYNKAGGTTVKYATEEFAKGDWILVYPEFTTAAGAFKTADKDVNILEATLADTAAGTLSKLTNNAYAPMVPGTYSALTIDGVSYSIGANDYAGPRNAQVRNGDYDLGTGMTAYLSNGFVLGVVADAVAYGDYVFVLGSSAVQNTLKEWTYRAGTVDQTAATAEDLATKNVSGLQYKWATKEEASGGKYTFAEGLAKDGKTSLTKGFTLTELNSAKATIGPDIIADANTVFVIRSVNSKTGVASFKAYTGLANVPNFGTKATVSLDAYALVPDYTGAHAAAVYIDAATTPADTTAAATIYMLGTTYDSIEKSGSTTLYNYSAIVDGAATTLQVAGAPLDSSFKGAGLYTPTYSGSYLASVEWTTSGVTNKTAIKASDTYTITVDGGVITLPNGENLVLDSSAVAYIYTNAFTPVESGDPTELLNGLSGGWFAAVNVKNKTSVKEVYFVVDPTLK